MPTLIFGTCCPDKACGFANRATCMPLNNSCAHRHCAMHKVTQLHNMVTVGGAQLWVHLWHYPLFTRNEHLFGTTTLRRTKCYNLGSFRQKCIYINIYPIIKVQLNTAAACRIYYIYTYIMPNIFLLLIFLHYIIVVLPFFFQFQSGILHLY